ncbi:MAG: Eco29kI family restriction endonuclease [Synergistaceae bacterium]|jgi:tetrahydromethanopterin S-methyltransferase subunit E|nr:Eco29kI family restriction endonuclease [Synergistaceae bacterium]
MASKETPPAIKPFNPLDKRNLGESVADALLEIGVQILPPDAFIGAGVYALYYTGSFPTYAELSEVNSEHQFRYPIYIKLNGSSQNCVHRWHGMVKAA